MVKPDLNTSKPHLLAYFVFLWRILILCLASAISATSSAGERLIITCNRLSSSHLTPSSSAYPRIVLSVDSRYTHQARHPRILTESLRFTIPALVVVNGCSKIFNSLAMTCVLSGLASVNSNSWLYTGDETNVNIIISPFKRFSIRKKDLSRVPIYEFSKFAATCITTTTIDQ
jgi:hypothetical protein